MSTLTGTGTLIRLAVRRDRIRLPAWIVTFAGVAAISASATVSLYPSAGSRIQAAEAINNSPALVALYGRIYDPASLGSVAMLKLTAFGAALAGVLCALTVIRHTRAEEEAGRMELLGAGLVGRRAALTAGLVVAMSGALLLGLLAAAGLVAAGLPAAGSVAFGAGWAATGIVFAGAGALAAQASRSTRTSTMFAAGTIIAAYLLRAAGDSTALSWLSWLSPIGWGQQVRPFAGDRWPVLLLPVAAAILTSGAAYALAGRRDLGRGLLPDRPGPAAAGPALRGPLGLAWRLHRGVLAAWAVVFVLLGLVLGNVASDVEGMLGSPQARDMIARLGGQQSMINAFLAAELGFLAIFASVYGVAAVGRMRGEEASLRAAAILAAPVGRIRWAASHLAFAFGGTAVLITIAGLSLGAAHGARTGDASQPLRLAGAALAHLPAAWIVTAVALAVFGLLPRAPAVAWACLVTFVLITELGPLLELSHWIMDVSPFTHTPKLPGTSLDLAPVLWLAAAAAVLSAAGLAGLRRRAIRS